MKTKEDELSAVGAVQGPDKSEKRVLWYLELLLPQSLGVEFYLWSVECFVGRIYRLLLQKWSLKPKLSLCLVNILHFNCSQNPVTYLFAAEIYRRFSVVLLKQNQNAGFCVESPSDTELTA